MHVTRKADELPTTSNEPRTTNHEPRTTNGEPKIQHPKSKILILGAGVVGSSVAYHLAERGETDVLVIDRGEGPGAGSTGRATGGVRAQFETDINIRMSLYSIDFISKWDVDCEYDPKGYLFFATDGLQMDYLRSNVERQTELGVKGVEVLSVEDVRRICPILECDDILGGTFGASDGFVNPLKIMGGFADGARSEGVRFEYGVAAQGLEVEGGRVTAVVTDKGRIECERVVLAAGAWARELAATAGVTLPVEPQRRQIVWARSSEPLPRNLPMVIDIGTGFHFRPAKDFTDPFSSTDGSEVLFAYPDSEEGSSYVTDFDETFISKVYERAALRSSFLASTSVVRGKCRAGLYENTPDHHAILGGCEIEGLYFATGFSGHGVMHSPATGRALSEIILDGESSFLDVSCLSIERFKTGNLLRETAFI